MESQGLAGGIQVTPRIYQRLRNRYRFQRRGPIQVRGETAMFTYLLPGRNPDPARSR
jgi:adenylate cyclase